MRDNRLPLELLTAHSEDLGLYDDGVSSKNETIIAEMKRLRQQVDHAHTILGSEAMIWLIGGSEHAGSWISALGPAVHSYWNQYGTVFRQPTMIKQHTPEETDAIRQQHGDYVEEARHG